MIATSHNRVFDTPYADVYSFGCKCVVRVQSISVGRRRVSLDRVQDVAFVQTQSSQRVHHLATHLVTRFRLQLVAASSDHHRVQGLDHVVRRCELPGDASEHMVYHLSEQRGDAHDEYHRVLPLGFLEEHLGHPHLPLEQAERVLHAVLPQVQRLHGLARGTFAKVLAVLLGTRKVRDQHLRRTQVRRQVGGGLVDHGRAQDLPLPAVLHRLVPGSESAFSPDDANVLWEQAPPEGVHDAGERFQYFPDPRHRILPGCETLPAEVGRHSLGVLPLPAHE